MINLAAQAGVRYSLINPKAYIDSNIIGFFNLMECSREFKIKKVIYAIYIEIYINISYIWLKFGGGALLQGKSRAAESCKLYSEDRSENLAEIFSEKG